MTDQTDGIRFEGNRSISIHADVVTWAERQASLLRRIAAGEQVNEQIDWEEIAEEIASVGASERRSLGSHIRNIIEHLAKLEASPADDPRPGWEITIQRARAEVKDLLESSPSLRATLDEVVAKQLPRGLSLAVDRLLSYGETPRVPVERIKYTADQVVENWFPGGK